MTPGSLAFSLALAALALTSLAACGRGGTDCNAAAGNAVALISADLEREGKAEDKERKNKESMLPALKESLVKSCKAEKWSEDIRSCIATAKTSGALEECDPARGLGKNADSEEPEDAPAPDPETEPGTESAPATE